MSLVVVFVKAEKALVAPARHDSQENRSDSGGEPQHQFRSGMVRGRLVDLPRTTQCGYKGIWWNW